MVAIQTDRLTRRLAGRGIELTLTDDARRLIGDLGYDPVYGARPLKRVIQKQLVDRLALALLDGRLRDGERVSVDAEAGQLVFGGELAGHGTPAATGATGAEA
ncbi:MAG: hypothetical protein LC720_02690 [Actinobacteria bacterium]|nr:hypothetical protein [Actinomycetota bacterium]